MGHHPRYLKTAASPDRFSLVVDNLVKALAKPEHKDVVALAGKGHSGIPFVAAATYLTKLAPIYVRSTSTDSHDNRLSTSCLDTPLCITPVPFIPAKGRYVIVDDLISSGKTMKTIIERVAKDGYFENSLPSAIFLYLYSDVENQVRGRCYEYAAEDRPPINIPIIDLLPPLDNLPLAV